MPEGEFRPSPDIKPNAGILPEKFPELHTSPEVSQAVASAKNRGEHIPNDPKEKVSRYLGSLMNRHGLLGGGGERQQRQIAKHVIKPDEIPEGYFENQRRIAREQGHGDIEITSEMRQQMTEAVVADQTKSLERWVNYINHPDANYPAWFRYYAIRSVLTLGQYNKEKHQFSKRSKGTTAPFVDLNREALAYVYDKLNQDLEGKPIQEQDDDRLAPLLKSKNFGKFYAHAVEHVTPASKEQRQIIAGEWVRYDQIEDAEEGEARAKKLSDSLGGHGTGWCTAGESTAYMQLKGGDFYVYYSYDEDNKPTIPRIAIRMENEQVAEVRGIDKDQELESTLIETAEEKLADLPGGEAFKQKAADMKLLTKIEKKHKEKEELSAEELRFLYQIDRRIEGFGYEEDPRIEELQSQRTPREDGARMFSCTQEEIALHRAKVTNETIAFFGNYFSIPDNNEGSPNFPSRLRYIHGIADFNESDITNLGNLENIGGDAYFRKSKIATLGKLKSIGGCADFRQSAITDLGELKTIKDYAFFGNSQITDLGKLEYIGGTAGFMESKVTSLGELKIIGGDAIFAGSKITDLAKLELIAGEAEFWGINNLGELRAVGFNARFGGSRFTDLGKLTDIGGEADFTDSKVADLKNLEWIGLDTWVDEHSTIDRQKLQEITQGQVFTHYDEYDEEDE